jgi:LPXTG-motif cell wall-anchored protein
MPITFTTRIAAIAAATAVAAAGVLVVAAPASAAGESIVLANDSIHFTENNWGEGISLTGTGFGVADGNVAHVNVGTLNGPTFTAWNSTPLDIPVVSGGTVAVTDWIPDVLPQLPASGLTPVVQVTYELCSGNSCEFSETADVYANLVIDPFVPGDPGITITPGCNTVEQIKTDGYTIVVTGLGQFENVTDSVVGPDGQQFGDVAQLQADVNGTATGDFTLSGDVQLGIYTEKIVRGIEGNEVVFASGTFEVGTCAAPAPAPVPAAPKLAETGSSDGGLLAGGAFTFLLAGTVLMVGRRRRATV